MSHVTIQATYLAADVIFKAAHDCSQSTASDTAQRSLVGCTSLAVVAGGGEGTGVHTWMSYIYVYMYIYIYIYMCICVCICIHIYVYRSHLLRLSLEEARA